MQPIRPFFWPGISPAPPTLYTQELSFLEMVGALTAKLNTVIDTVNQMQEQLAKTLASQSGETEV